MVTRPAIMMDIRVRPAAREQRALGRSERQALVEQLFRRVKEWRSSPFEFEGSAIAGIRSQLCLDGHRWGVSDRDARDVVAEALSRTGAKRPSWDDGQRTATDYDGNCLYCRSEIPDDQRSAVLSTVSSRFCSPHCASMMRFRQDGEWSLRESAVARNAARVLKRETLPEVTCKHCEKPFRPFALNPNHWSYCSIECSGLGRRKLEERKCPSCDKTFHPRRGEMRFCSNACRGQSLVKLERRTCRWCAIDFQPWRRTQVYCSLEHAKEAAAEPTERTCTWCAGTFQGSGRAEMCSSACVNALSSFRTGKLRSLTSGAFDYMLRCQGVRITQPKITDRLFEAA